MKNKYFVKPVLLSSLVGILLTACNGGGTTPKSASLSAKNLTNEVTQGVSFGSPAVSADSATFVLADRNKCIDIPGETPISLGTATTKYNFNKNMSTSEILDSLGVNGSLKGAISSVSGDFEAEYEKANTASQLDYRTTFYISAERPINLPALQLAPEQPSLIDCGDGFVSGGVGGIYYTASLIVHFNSLADKMKLIADGDLKAKDLGELAAKLTLAQKKEGTNFDVKLEIVQRGGSSEEILSTFNDLKNLGLENEAKTFYLAELGPENMAEAGKIVQNYISDKLKPQIANLSTIEKLSVASSELFITNPKKTTYSNTTNHYTRPDDLNTIITTLETRFKELKTFKQKYEQYVSFVNNYKDIPNAITPVANSGKNWTNLLGLQDQILARSKTCFSYLPTESDIDTCKKNLKTLSDEVTSDLETINASKWGYGYPINVRTGVITEGLLPIAENLESGTTFFVSVANAPLNAYYFPGSEYIYDSKEKTITNVNIVFPDNESGIVSNRTLQYSGAIITDTALSATKVEYADLNSDFKEYTATNYPGNADETLAKKISRRASTSSMKSNLFLSR